MRCGVPAAAKIYGLPGLCRRVVWLFRKTILFTALVRIRKGNSSNSEVGDCECRRPSS